MDQYYVFGYDPVDLDDELFLTEAPLDLLEEMIESQFDDPLDNRKHDYVQSFITKYDYSKENGHEDDQYIYDELFEEFIRFMKQLFNDRLDVSFPDIDELQDDDALELIQLTYRFFIENMKKNFVTLIENHIDNDKPTIVANLDEKKDVTTNTYRLELDDPDDVRIIANLGLIIKDYLNDLATNKDVDDFFRYCVGDSLCLETEFVRDKFDQFRLVGNFVRKYTEMVDRNFQSEIESKIRNHILKKYAHKRKGVMQSPKSVEDETLTIDE